MFGILGSELKTHCKMGHLTEVQSDVRILSAAAQLEDIEGMETAALAQSEECVCRPCLCASLC